MNISVVMANVLVNAGYVMVTSIAKINLMKLVVVSVIQFTLVKKFLNLLVPVIHAVISPEILNPSFDYLSCILLSHF